MGVLLFLGGSLTKGFCGFPGREALHIKWSLPALSCILPGGDPQKVWATRRLLFSSYTSRSSYSRDFRFVVRSSVRNLEPGTRGFGLWLGFPFQALFAQIPKL